VSAAPHPAPERCCAVCGGTLAELRPTAVVCGPSCRRERSRLLRLLAGETVEGYGCLAAYLNRRQKACAPPPKISGGRVSRQANRTARAGGFVEECCARRPDQVTIARAVYAAYLRWAEAHEPDAPLSRSAFDAVVARRAPLEDRVSVAGGGRGRPRLAFRGIALIDPAVPTHARAAAVAA
jgi:hypothetical protein